MFRRQDGGVGGRGGYVRWCALGNQHLLHMFYEDYDCFKCADITVCTFNKLGVQEKREMSIYIVICFSKEWIYHTTLIHTLLPFYLDFYWTLHFFCSSPCFSPLPSTLPQVSHTPNLLRRFYFPCRLDLCKSRLVFALLSKFPRIVVFFALCPLTKWIRKMWYIYTMEY